MRPPGPSCARWTSSGFNPHPPRQVGATRERTGAQGRVQPCFNPHPPRQVGATAPTEPGPHLRGGVSILTHLGKWVRRPGLARTQPSIRSFNPHPPRQVGATCHLCTVSQRNHFVSILTHLGKWVRRYPRRPIGPAATRRFNPHPPRQVGATPSRSLSGGRGCPVSILTHLGKWVRRLGCAKYFVHGYRVSILTHLGKWVRLGVRSGGDDPQVLVSILTHLGKWVRPRGPSSTAPCMTRFNPHPPRQVGATRPMSRAVSPRAVKFQSSPT